MKHKKLVSDLGFKHLSSFTGGELIVTMAVEDYTKKDRDVEFAITNEVSLPRDLYCGTCNRQVIMSNVVFRMYRERPKSVKNELICGSCFLPKYGLVEKDLRTNMHNKIAV